MPRAAMARTQTLSLTTPALPAGQVNQISSTSDPILFDGILTDFEISVPADSSMETILFLNGEQIAPSVGSLKSDRARDINGTVGRRVMEGDVLLLQAKNSSSSAQQVNAIITLNCDCGGEIPMGRFAHFPGFADTED